MKMDVTVSVQQLAEWEQITNELGAEVKRLEGEIQRLREWTYCAYCGHEEKADNESADAISQHIWDCPKHPMRRLIELLRTAPQPQSSWGDENVVRNYAVWFAKKGDVMGQPFEKEPEKRVTFSEIAGVQEYKPTPFVST